MNIDEQNRQDLTDRYILNELSESERIAFEEAMKQDSELREEVELMKLISDGFQQKGEKEALDEIMSLSSEEEFRAIIADAEKKYNKKPKIRRLIIGLSSAAAVLLILIYIGIQPRYSSEQLFDEYYVAQAYEAIPTRGGSILSEEQEIQFSRAVEFYKEKNYAGSLALFDKIMSELKPKDIPEEILFYSAVCMTETGRTDDAIKNFEKLSSSDEAELQEQAEWNLALAYLKNNQQNKAKEILSIIIKNKGEYAGKAEELMNKSNAKKWF